jgi:hypothetical protein
MMPPLCVALGLFPSPAGSSVADAASCLYVDVDVAGQIGYTTPDDGIAALASLPRGRAELGLTGSTYGARFAVEPVRSGGLTSTIGIDGESIMARYQIAEAWVALPRLGLRGGAGIIDDPWVVTANEAWGLRAAAPTLGEATGWMDRSDVGLIGSFTAPKHVASLAVSLTNGEGARAVERNNGKDTTALLVIHPLAITGGDPGKLSLSLMGRDGSRALSSASDRRTGGRMTGILGPVNLGAEYLKAWGVDGDTEAKPSGWSAWARGTLPADLTLFARVDQTTDIPSDNASNTTILRGGIGWSPAEPALIIGGVEQTNAGAQASAIAGAQGLSNTTTLYLLLNVQHRGAVTLMDMDQ